MNRRSRQKGVVLLAFMLIIIAGSSYMLMTRLNRHAYAYVRDTVTEQALLAARDGLLSYAMNYPDLRGNQLKGPGFLPCPDLDGDGGPDNCSFGSGTTLGRLPYRILGLGDLRDSGGERLWYAVSDKFRNTLSNNTDTVINSDTPGQFSVDGTDDVVAVILAPGEPLTVDAVCSLPFTSQDTRPGNNAGLYLEYENNAVADTSFVTTPSDPDCPFNDRLAVITRQDLTSAAQARVTHELRSMLAAYNDAYAAYPWLTPYADPQSGINTILAIGEHDDSSNSPDLKDGSMDFVDMGVAVGDIVANLSDGSFGYVTEVDEETLKFAAGLALGADNDFDNNDEYVVYQNLSTNTSRYGRLNGTTDGGSSGLVLKDFSVDFPDLGVSPGDVVDNTSNVGSVSSGLVQSVAANTLVLASLKFTNGTDDAFAAGDSYRIRSSLGRATSGSGFLVLEDTSRNFPAMGVRTGDLLINISDGSMGRVEGVALDTLTVNQLQFGVNNTFSTGNYYVLPRFNTDNSSRQGLLAFHETGKPFLTDFRFEWKFNNANKSVMPATGLHATYTAALQNHLTGIPGSLDIDFDNGRCTWVTDEFVDCIGTSTGPYLDGTVTAGNDSAFLIDSTKNFNTYGIKRGDVIQNYDDTTAFASGSAKAGSGELLLVDTGVDFSTYDPAGLYNYVVIKNGDLNTVAVIEKILPGPNAGQKNTLRLIQAPKDTPLTFAAGDSWQIRAPQKLVVAAVTSNTTLFTGNTSNAVPDFDGSLDEFYRILTATRSISGVNQYAAVGNTLWDPSADFTGVSVGDIVENVFEGAFGVITSIPDSHTLTAQLYLPTNPGSVTTRSFHFNQNYIIRYGYVGARNYRLKARYPSDTAARIYGVNGVRKRDVCIGYQEAPVASCNTTATQQPASLPAYGGTPVITITDRLDRTMNTAVTATATIISGTTTGSMKTAGLDLYLREAPGEIPEWFIKNKWYRYLYFAYSSGVVPGGGNSCTPGTNCLLLNRPDRPATAPVLNDREVLVLASGMQLANQDRASGGTDSGGFYNDYFEGDNPVNATQDNVFESNEISGGFNDQVSTVAPSTF